MDAKSVVNGDASFCPLLVFLSSPLFAGCSEKDNLKRVKKNKPKPEVSFVRCFASGSVGDPKY